MIRYYKYQNNSSIERVNGKWFLRIKNGETVDLQGLANHMASHASGFTEGQIYGILTDMVNCVQELVLDGKSVKIPNLALFSLGIHCTGANNADEATVSNIRSIHMNARGTGKFTPAQLKEKVKYKELDTYSI